VRTFDLDGRIVSYPLGNTATTGMTRTLAYDAASRITSMTHAGAGTPAAFDQTFGYDGLHRLTSFTSSSGSQTYTYDATGNRTQQKLGTVPYANTISTTSNRLISAAGPTPKNNVFDPAGNVTSDGVTTSTYGDRGRLKNVSNALAQAAYLYNGLGQRVAKTSTLLAAGVNFYTYDEEGKLLGEYAANSAPVQETVYLGSQPVAVLSSSILYVYADHIDTPRVLAKSSDGAIVWRWDGADPFGAAMPNEDPASTGTVVVYNPRFPGQLYDRETGRHYNYFRDYDPQTGRYVQSDPIGLNGGINTYGYAEATPVTKTDALGLLTSDKHMTLTMTALNYSGFSASFMNEVVAASVLTDFKPTFEIAQSVASSHSHAMGKPKEPVEKSYAGYENYVNSMINRCDAVGLGNALHAVQDSAAGGHGFKTYTGSVGLLHIIADFWPSKGTLKEAQIKSQNVIDRYKERCLCKK
jgi:RHS repeat-associated protein